MATATEALCGRVDELIRSHKAGERLLSTTGTQVAIGELIERTEGLEQAIREIALEVERIAAMVGDDQ